MSERDELIQSLVDAMDELNDGLKCADFGAARAIKHASEAVAHAKMLAEKIEQPRDEDLPTAVMRVQPVASDWREFASRIERIGNDSDCPGDRDALIGIARQMRGIALHVEAEHARKEVQ